jgi:hypothetical protein
MHRWNVPSLGVAKVNRDATILMDETTQKMGVGVIVRDHEDNVLVTMSSSKPYIIDLVVTKKQ